MSTAISQRDAGSWFEFVHGSIESLHSLTQALADRYNDPSLIRCAQTLREALDELGDTP